MVFLCVYVSVFVLEGKVFKEKSSLAEEQKQQPEAKPQMETQRYCTYTHSGTRLNTHINTDMCPAGHTEKHRHINTPISMT